MFDVDDCLPISQVDAWHIHLEPTSETAPLVATSAYHIIPPHVLRTYADRRGLGISKQGPQRSSTGGG